MTGSIAACQGSVAGEVGRCDIILSVDDVLGRLPLLQSKTHAYPPDISVCPFVALLNLKTTYAELKDNVC